MPSRKSAQYHAILDLLDRGQTDAAAERLFDWVTDVGRVAERPTSRPYDLLSRQEFRLLLNAFIRRGGTVRTA